MAETVNRRIARGTKFEVRLPEIPSTGYQWRTTTPATDVVTQISSQWVADADEVHGIRARVARMFRRPEDLPVGGGGTRIYTFEAVRDGSARLEFEYSRAWERKNAVYDRKVHVEEIDVVARPALTAPIGDATVSKPGRRFSRLGMAVGLGLMPVACAVAMSFALPGVLALASTHFVIAVATPLYAAYGFATGGKQLNFTERMMRAVRRNSRSVLSRAGNNSVQMLEQAGDLATYDFVKQDRRYPFAVVRRVNTPSKTVQLLTIADVDKPAVAYAAPVMEDQSRLLGRPVERVGTFTRIPLSQVDAAMRADLKSAYTPVPTFGLE